MRGIESYSKPSTGWAAVSPTSVCCDRLHISPPTCPSLLRLVVSGWRRGGQLLRLTMVRCCAFAGQAPVTCPVTPHASIEGQPNPHGVDVDGNNCCWFVSQIEHSPLDIVVPLPQPKKPKTQATVALGVAVNHRYHGRQLCTHEVNTREKGQGCCSVSKARVRRSGCAPAEPNCCRIVSMQSFRVAAKNSGRS